MIYDYECASCKKRVEVACKMSEREDNIPECHGPMVRLITNKNKHTDNTGTRKGYFNSHEGRHR
jgi:putative FmdB family regulatory protein